MKKKENISDWTPYFLVFGENAYDENLNRNIGFYERNWFCYTNKIIHHSEKDVLNCAHCSKKYYK